ncbi:MAG: acyl-CoA thioesterase [Planctomycetes bacterium]|nr:acyl-CoA thioesterase [Planctomycetota bacterium]
MTSFRTTRRVEFGDTDMAGIVHFSNFFRYMEAAETEFLRSRGLSVSWREAGLRVGFPRVSAACDYVKPAFFEDVLDVAVTLERIGGKSLTYRFDFSRKGEAIATGRITSVYCREVTGHGLESLEIPVNIREMLA